jgi:NAD(P)-dependent dehydrogenase (short-subunit alcohol dehydrogenase family)
MDFTGKVALVTGAASGIGEACAKVLASHGAAVVVADIDVANGERVVGELRADGATASFWATDVADADHVEALMRHIIATHGGLHLAVNNAGIGCAPTLFHETPLETWDLLYGINLRGVMLCMRAELAHFVQHGGGAIVNTASGAGMKAAWGLAPYVMTKHGVIGLTRNAALEYADKGIRVNAVAPGPILTPAMRAFPQEQQDMWSAPVPMKRLGKPEEIGMSVAFLLSDDASYTNGLTMEIDGGYLQGPPPA